MPNTALLADLSRALELLEQVDESGLEFSPDGETSPDISELTGVKSYPVDSHKNNVKARIEAVIKAGDKFKPRAASDYVSKLIPACVKLAPHIDDWRTSLNKDQ